MRHRTAWRSLLLAAVALLATFGLAGSAVALPAHDFKGPVFGLGARRNVLFAADSGAGIVRITSSSARLIVHLPNVVDVIALGRGRFLALTSAPRDKKLYFVRKRHVHEVANLGRYEKRVNPDGAQVDSNPFDIARAGGLRVLVADAGGNDLLLVNRKSGHINWVATLPSQDVSTQNAKDLAGCPTPPDPSNQSICDLPDTMPAEAVPTSVAVGPDGAFYVTELKGFPAPLRRSRVWRIAPNVRHVQCKGSITTNGCTVVARNLTSLVDIEFDSTGTPDVVELDEASWLAVDSFPSQATGGTIDQCDTSVMPWDCTVRQGGLTEPMAIAFTSSDALYAVIKALKAHPAIVAVP
jgi:hypothetical protein